MHSNTSDIDSIELLIRRDQQELLLRPAEATP